MKNSGFYRGFAFFLRNFYGIILSMTAALNLIKDLKDAVKDRDAKILCLEEQLAWFKRQLFGKKSERIVSDLATIC